MVTGASLLPSDFSLSASARGAMVAAASRVPAEVKKPRPIKAIVYNSLRNIKASLLHVVDHTGVRRDPQAGNAVCPQEN